MYKRSAGERSCKSSLEERKVFGRGVQEREMWEGGVQERGAQESGVQERDLGEKRSAGKRSVRETLWRQKCGS